MHYPHFVGEHVERANSRSTGRCDFTDRTLGRQTLHPHLPEPPGLAEGNARGMPVLEYVAAVKEWLEDELDRICAE